MRPSALYLLPLLLGVALYGSAAALHRVERKRAFELWSLAKDVETASVVDCYRDTFRSVYEGLRTIARLPSVRGLQRRQELDADARTTAQEVYNNLAQHVAMSEAYIVPEDFEPDALDPATGVPQVPLAEFDSLIAGHSADARAAELEPDAAHPAAPAGEVEEIEIFEYRQMRQQIARFRQLCPQEHLIEGLEYPAVCSGEVTTCDNRYYSAIRREEGNRRGLVYSVPFYRPDGRLGGCISGVILTRELRQLLPSGSYALHNDRHGLLAPAMQQGPWQDCLPDILAGRAAAELAYSRSLPIDVDDIDGGWRLWVGHADAEFDVSPFAQKADAVFQGLVVAVVALVAGLAFATRTIARQRRSDRDYATELERARDAAVELARAKSDFVAVASHEIRTPMNGVLGMTELLLLGELSPAQRDLAETARQSAQTLVDLLHCILDYSRLEAGKVALERTVFEPATAIEDVVQLLAPTAAQKQLSLRLHLGDGLPRHVVGDPGALRQVATNLVGNAVKFTLQGSVDVHLDLDAESGNGLLRLRVVDTGIGLDQAQKQRLFQPFAQADSSTTRRFGGSGLGLAISRGLVAAMGGTLDFTPTPGGGTTFTATLQFEAARVPAAPAPLHGRTIALLEPDPVLRQSLESLLRHLGADVATIDAATDLAARVPDAILCAAAIDDADQQCARVRSRWPGARWIRTGPFRTDPTGERSDGVLRLPTRLERLAGKITGSSATAGATPSPTAPAGLALIVDDNEINLRVAQLLMERLGYRCQLAADGQTAVQLASEADHDVVLMDVQMPGLDGLGATRRIRAAEQAAGRRRVPIIAVTANTTADDENGCREAGMDAFLAKPVRLATLTQALAQLPIGAGAPPVHAT